MTISNPDPDTTGTSGKQLEELLRTYEPILRFSEGERFFPMRIEDYVEGCTLENYQEKSRLDHESEKTIHYLEYIYGGWKKKLEHYQQFIWYIVGIISLAVIEFALLPLHIHTAVASVVTALVLLAWPYYQLNRRVYLAFVLNVAGIAFFGTNIAILAGATILFTVLLLAVLHAVYDGSYGTGSGCASMILVFVTGLGFKYSPIGLDYVLDFFGLQLNSLLPPLMIQSGERMVVWHSAALTGGFIEIVALTVLVMIILGNGIKGRLLNNPLILALFIVTAFSLAWWWYFVLMALYSMIHNGVQPPRPWLSGMNAGALKIRKLKVYLRQQIVVLAGIAVPLAIFMLSGFSASDLGRVVMGSTILIVGGIALAWFFVEDIDIMLSVNGRKMGLLTAGIALWFSGNLWYQSVSQTQLIPIFMFPVLAIHLVNAAISIVLLGGTVFSALMDVQSSQTDFAAHEAAIKYEDTFRNKAGADTDHIAKPQGHYYGRIKNSDDGKWKVLQYHYFYQYLRQFDFEMIFWENHPESVKQNRFLRVM